MANVVFALVLLIAILTTCRAAIAPILNTRHLGQIVGAQEFSENGIPYYSFRGLRYAVPPVGPLRFKEPRESSPVSTNSIVNATAFGPSCLQIDSDSSTPYGSEDCLLLNVYTPSASQGDLYPVMVYLHRGGFTSGNATEDPSRLVSRGIVVVTIQFRLGVLGFLSSGDQDLPGNLGLLDQQLALRWIQQNIYEFRGDRDRVTLAGGDSGGALTTLHMLSPGSRGLFQRAIATSGVFLMPWVLHTGNPEKVRAVASSVGCRCASDTPIAMLMPCLRSADPNKLAEALLLFRGWNGYPVVPLGPVIDRNFMSEDPFKILIDGNVAKVPLLMSYAPAEVGIRNIADILENTTALAELDRDWMQLAPLVLDYGESALTQEDQDFTSSTIRSKYFGRAPINNSTVPQLIQLESDRRKLAGLDQYAKTLASAMGSEPVYLYLYSYLGEGSESSSWSINRDPERVSDAAQVLPWSSPSTQNGFEAQMGVTESLVTIWESFIKTGVPTTSKFPVWNPVPLTGDRLTFWNITSLNTGTLTTLRELGRSSFYRRLPLIESGNVRL